MNAKILLISLLVLAIALSGCIGDPGEFRVARSFTSTSDGITSQADYTYTVSGGEIVSCEGTHTTVRMEEVEVVDPETGRIMTETVEKTDTGQCDVEILRVLASQGGSCIITELTPDSGLKGEVDEGTFHCSWEVLP